MAAPGKGPLRIAIEDFIDGFKFGDRVNTWFGERFDMLKKGSMGDAWGQMINELGVNNELPSFLKAGSAPLALGTAAVIPMLIGALLGLGFSFISVLIQPIALRAQYLVNRKWIPYRIDPRNLTSLLKIFPSKQSDWLRQLSDNGVDETSLNGLQALNRQYLTSFQYVMLWRRGDIPESVLNEYLTQLQIFEGDFDNLKNVTKMIPGPSDLISMAVREAWNDQIAGRFNYDAGLGDIPQFNEWMQKQGFDADWAKRYWRAHWQIPGVNQGYEMLHRLRSGENQFTQADMELMLRTADIPEFFRKRLIAISYAPYTRVDIRRMYGANVLNADQVKSAYLDIGYDEEHATNLTKFTTSVEKAEERGLTRDAIQGAYRRGIYSRDVAKQAIIDIGFNTDDAEFWLDLTDYDTEAKNTDEKLSAIQAKYEGGLLDESTVYGALGALNLPSERVLSMLEVWTIRRNNRIALPSRSELDDLLRRQIIMTDIYRTYLKRDGYPAEVIEWYTKRIDEIIVQDTISETLSAQAEQERIQRATRSTQYQKDRADLDVKIAQTKAVIADIALALHDITDESTITQLKEQVLMYKNDIVHLNLEKSQLKLDFTTSTPQG